MSAPMEEIVEDILKRVSEIYSSKEESVGGDVLRHLERMVCLQVIDSKWKGIYLYAIIALREEMSLRAYGQPRSLSVNISVAYGCLAK